LLGLFDEQVWQSGATLETLANVLLLPQVPPRLSGALLTLLNTSFEKTPVIVDVRRLQHVVQRTSTRAQFFPSAHAPIHPQNCFDDHQWYGLAWVRAFTATSDKRYLARAAAVFDFTAEKGWDEGVCGGGVTWCPPPTGVYKNAITVELFISLAMALHPHAAAAGKAPAFYSNWAAKAWVWLARPGGMVNELGLVNDGLDGATCANNNQTTWSYNQGVLLSGLYRLGIATGDPAPLAAAQRTAAAAMQLLTINGILTEPCADGLCDADQQIFKGMFVKHLSYVLFEDAAAPAPRLAPEFVAAASAFLAVNARSLLAADACGDGGFGLRWDGSACDVETTATSSAALDLLAGAAAASAPFLPPPAWGALGVGNCEDDAGQSMNNCYRDGITFATCRAAAFSDPVGVAFDYHSDCAQGKVGFCRVRTAAVNCASSGFIFEAGAATSVTKADGSALAVCFLKGP
jgi:predicted alpha-1,6-mannanase (GH76 family)